MFKKRERAFTLVEMMAVVVIIGILAAVIAPKFFNQVGSAQRTTAEKEIATIKQAITLYRFDTNKLPEELKDLRVDPDIKGWNGPYVDKKKFKDPWDNDYQYNRQSKGDREYDLFSFGPDGQEGGEGDDADITEWDEDDE